MRDLFFVLFALILLFVAGCQLDKTGAAIGPDPLCVGIKCVDYCGNGDESSVRYYSGTCQSGSCSYLSSDCNALDKYLPEPFCKNGDVYKTFRNYYCSNGKCVYEELEFLQQRCTKGCDSGACIP